MDLFNGRSLEYDTSLVPCEPIIILMQNSEVRVKVSNWLCLDLTTTWSRFQRQYPANYIIGGCSPLPNTACAHALPLVFLLFLYVAFCTLQVSLSWRPMEKFVTRNLHYVPLLFLLQSLGLFIQKHFLLLMTVNYIEENGKNNKEQSNKHKQVLVLLDLSIPTHLRSLFQGMLVPHIFHGCQMHISILDCTSLFGAK